MNDKPNDADRANAINALFKAQFAMRFAQEIREASVTYAKQVGVTDQQITMAIEHGNEMYEGEL